MRRHRRRCLLRSGRRWGRAAFPRAALRGWPLDRWLAFVNPVEQVRWIGIRAVLCPLDRLIDFLRHRAVHLIQIGGACPVLLNYQPLEATNWIFGGPLVPEILGH